MYDHNNKSFVSFEWTNFPNSNRECNMNVHMKQQLYPPTPQNGLYSIRQNMNSVRLNNFKLNQISCFHLHSNILNVFFALSLSRLPIFIIVYGSYNTVRSSQYGNVSWWRWWFLSCNIISKSICMKRPHLHAQQILFKSAHRESKRKRKNKFYTAMLVIYTLKNMKHIMVNRCDTI